MLALALGPLGDAVELFRETSATHLCMENKVLLLHNRTIHVCVV